MFLILYLFYIFHKEVYKQKQRKITEAFSYKTRTQFTNILCEGKKERSDFEPESTYHNHLLTNLTTAQAWANLINCSFVTRQKSFEHFYNILRHFLNLILNIWHKLQKRSKLAKDKENHEIDPEVSQGPTWTVNRVERENRGVSASCGRRQELGWGGGIRHAFEVPDCVPKKCVVSRNSIWMLKLTNSCSHV